MALIEAAHYRPQGQLVARQIAGETILVPVKGRLADLQRLFALEGAGAFIWPRLAAGRSLAEIRDEMALEFSIPAEKASVDLNGFVGELLQAGLIEPVP